MNTTAKFNGKVFLLPLSLFFGGYLQINIFGNYEPPFGQTFA
jgi:hypothetical protein